MSHRRSGAWLLAVPALMAATASCDSGTDHPSSASSEPSASVSAPPSLAGSAPAGSSVSGSPSSGRSASAPAGTPAATSGGSARLCLSGTVTVLYPASDNPLRSTCVHVGTRIQITLKPPANYSWAPVTSSAPTVVTVLDNQIAPDGTRSATARAATPGTATLESADTYTPDPHGPPSRPWQLTLTVVP
ncbi:hypothetical protein [Streptomyces sp. NBC_01615]|uniref:hypothetical protein n=1 Tax=Streptomyces sp. NBC_01615 TaxID=2975898 RepID=UPI0038686649